MNSEVEEHRILSVLRRTCDENDAHLSVLSLDASQRRQLQIVTHYRLNVSLHIWRKIFEWGMGIFGVLAAACLSIAAQPWAWAYLGIAGWLSVFAMATCLSRLLMLREPMLRTQLEERIWEALMSEGFDVEMQRSGAMCVRWV